jgi:fructoselysine-6-P-deglycase FrlB-like protein
VRQAVARGFPTLVITGDGASMIAETGAELLVLPIGKEAIGPKTKGYTATVLSVFAVAARLGGQKLDTSKLAPALEKTVESGLAAAREFRSCFGLPDYVLVAGQGPHLGTALEAGLKIAEISGVPTASFDTEEAFHGHVYGTTQASLVIVIAQTEAEAKAAARLGEALTARGPRAAICNLSGHATRFDLAIDWPKAPALDWIAASWAVIPFQWYACELATARGVDPDKMIYPNLGAELGLRLKPVAP